MPTVAPEKPKSLWWVGVLVYVLGAVMMAAAVNMQKFSLNREAAAAEAANRARRRPRMGAIKEDDHEEGQDEGPLRGRKERQARVAVEEHTVESGESTSPSSEGDEVQPKAVWKQPFWLLGLLMYILSGVMLSAALVFATQTQVSPLMSIVLVSNVLFAHFLLKEPVDRRDILAISIIVIAVCLTTIAAPKSERLLTKEELLKLYTQGFFIAFVVVIVLLIIGIYVFNRVLQSRCEQDKANVNPTTWTQYGVTFASLAGCFGGLCVTFMKSSTTIIIDDIREGFVKFISSWVMWLLLIVLVCSWVLQLVWLNKGLALFPAIFVVSIEAIINEFVAVLGGMLYFQEYKLMTVGYGVLFGFGLLMGFGGVALFATKKMVVYDEPTISRRHKRISSQPYPSVYDDENEIFIRQSSSDEAGPLLAK